MATASVEGFLEAALLDARATSGHSSATEVSRFAIAACASPACAFKSGNFRPPYPAVCARSCRVRERPAASRRSFADELALELHQRREDAEHQATARASGVDLSALAGENAQAHAAVRQVLHGADEVRELAARAVQLASHQHVAVALGPQARLQPGPVVLDAGHVVLIDPISLDAVGGQRVPLPRSPISPAPTRRRSEAALNPRSLLSECLS